MILDDDFDVIQIITKYASGTDFKVFELLNVGDDGNFFAIERTNTGHRFVMMNNIIPKLPTAENYEVKLKKAYSLQGQLTNLEDDDFEE